MKVLWVWWCVLLIQPGLGLTQTRDPEVPVGTIWYINHVTEVGCSSQRCTGLVLSERLAPRTFTGVLIIYPEAQFPGLLERYQVERREHLVGKMLRHQPADEEDPYLGYLHREAHKYSQDNRRPKSALAP